MNIKSIILGLVVMLSLVCGPLTSTHAGNAGSLMPKFFYSNDQLLVLMAEKGNAEEVRKLVEQGADVNYEYDGKGTPLTQASKKGHTEIVRILMDAGANINKGGTIITGYHIQLGPEIPNEEGTPISWATFYDHPEVVRVLIEQGADLNKANIKGDTPLKLAARTNHTGCPKLLLKHGADVNLGNPIIDALVLRNTSLVQLLIEHGANLNKVINDNGWTPLIFAIFKHNTQAVKLMLDPDLPCDQRANVNIKDRNGESALDHAKKERCLQIQQLIEDQIT